MDGLTANALVERATGATGLDDFGGDSWEERLDCLLESLRSEARLSELGRAVVADELTGYLTTRLENVAGRERHPEIADAPVEPPVVIIGQGRTGTAILYDLLAQDPSSPCSTACRATPAGSSTRPTWRRPTGGTGPSSSTSGPATRSGAGS